jgi:hypothetical protein
MGETFDDPNREAVGLAPIWTGGAPGDDEESERDDREPEPTPSEDTDAERT